MPLSHHHRDYKHTPGHRRNMNKIMFSQLRQSNKQDIESTLPLTVTLDGKAKWVLLSVEQYKRLVMDYNALQSRQS